jgi:hypothetical protein
MAATDVAICNLALGILKSTKFIEAFRGQGDGTVEGSVFEVYYDDTLDLVLSRANWPFARKRATLVAANEDPPEEWGYSYVLPPDCLKARAVADGMRVRQFDESMKYAIENDGTGSGRVILMDVEPPAVLIYTMRATDVTIYSPEFIKALSWQLAAAVARPLDKSDATITQVLELAERFLGIAAAAAYNEEKPDAQPPSDFYTSRLC